ncbi:MAG: phosphate ABC transporter permease PstA [Gammaproteobacteria bacterium]|nr:phosphate ABC transporter permease PstA [Gammaproteobacteria bacterium]
MVFGLLIMIAVRGMSHFWPAQVLEFDYTIASKFSQRIAGEINDTVEVSLENLRNSGIELGKEIQQNSQWVTRHLIKTGNRDVLGSDFRWVLAPYMSNEHFPQDIIVLERSEWGNLYGYLKAIKQNGQIVSENSSAWTDLSPRLDRVKNIQEQIRDIEKHKIGEINYELEQLRLKKRGLELDKNNEPEILSQIKSSEDTFKQQFGVLQSELAKLYQGINRDKLVVEIMDGKHIEIPFAKIVRAYKPNDMSFIQRIGVYLSRAWEFVSDDPREANTEGGIFPAIFGTVMMVIIMSILVTPFGVVTAVYMHEYAKQGPVIRTIRIAVNNLAGVPSIVYGIFGLGFFVYFLGGNIDQLFFPEALPAPTFGTPGILWSSLTLAILTVPVVIVATEEGLSRIPRAIREGSLALGATKAETLWRTVLPMATPAMMTGLILAVARAAGEVAPLMLVGVVKLAPSLPLDGNFPFLHLERKFMHLGFHIYDVGFQSPNVEAARPLVYATALLLVIIIVILNLAAIWIRNNLREKYKAVEN